MKLATKSNERRIEQREPVGVDRGVVVVFFVIRALKNCSKLFTPY